MKREWSNAWKSSSQPRKQRKYRANAPLHIRGNMIAAHLSKELRDKHKKRSVPVVKGDKVKILRGQFRNTIGKVDRVLRKKYKLHIEGVEQEKINGQKAKYPIDPSNVTIIDLNKNDKKRVGAISRK